MARSTSPSERGFALITVVISLLVFSLFLTITLAQFSLDASSVAQTTLASAQSYATAQSCIESALRTLRGIPDLDDMHVNLPNGEGCDMEVERDGREFVIRSTAIVGTTTQSVEVQATRGDNTITVTAWSME